MLQTHPVLSGFAKLLTFLAAIVLVVVLSSLVRPFLRPLFAALIQPGVSALVGVLVGAGLSSFVAFSLQRDQFKGKALLEKKQSIYAPLLEDLLSFRSQLGATPYPSHIAHRSRTPSQSFWRPAGFFAWTDLVADGRLIHVPHWMRRAFEAFMRNLDEYNERYRQCNNEVEAALIADLTREGFIESASGFADLHLVLAEAYDARILTPFGVMRRDTSKSQTAFDQEMPGVLARLLRAYGQLESVVALRAFTAEQVLGRIGWLTRSLEKVIQLIEQSYGSRNRYL